MRITTRLACSLLAVLSVAGVATAADDGGAGPRVGEVRALAIAPGNGDAVAQLHRDGWLEARGQLVPVAALPRLFQTIGRAWTSDGVAQSQFAIPEVHDRSQREPVSSDNPSGVLGGGDLVQGGRLLASGARPNPLTYWIFAGQDVSRLGTAAVAWR